MTQTEAKAPKELTAEELKAQMKAMQEKNQALFQEEYNALCNKFEMQLVPFIKLMPGALPDAGMIVQPVPPKQG